MNELQKLRIIENNIKGYLTQVQFNNKISNDTLCLILGDILSSFEKARATDYLLEQLIREQEENRQKEESEKKEENEKKEADDGES